MQDTYKQLRFFMNESMIFQRFSTHAAHVWSLDNGQCSCGTCSDFVGSLECCDVNNCNYDLSGDSLRAFYGEIKPRKVAHPTLVHVDQWKYLPPEATFNATIGELPRGGLWKFALVYVPESCKERCIKKRLDRRRLWATSINLNEYAEANDIIVVYPQAAGSHGEGIGCWNWGDEKADHYFDTRRAVQLRTIMNLLEDLPNAIQNAKNVEDSLLASSLSFGAYPSPFPFQ
eukprot:g15330.t1